MRVVERWHDHVTIVVVAALMAAALGCASQPSAEPPAAVERDADELNCELALLRLETLIEARAAEPSFSAAALIEAREIYEMSRELYLSQEYELALRLIEEGIQLVE